eukprot:305340-Hanusia_phi.AAC.1
MPATLGSFRALDATPREEIHKSVAASHKDAAQVHIAPHYTTRDLTAALWTSKLGRTESKVTSESAKTCRQLLPSEPSSIPGQPMPFRRSHTGMPGILTDSGRTAQHPAAWQEPPSSGRFAGTPSLTVDRPGRHSWSEVLAARRLLQAARSVASEGTCASLRWKTEQ